MTTAPPPGWYVDQANTQLLRWWDGYRWTQHTQPNNQRPQHPGYQQPQQGYQQPQQGYQQPQQGYQQPQQDAPTAPGGAAGFAGQQAVPSGMPPGAPAMGGGHAAGPPLYVADTVLIAQKAKVFGVSSNAGSYQIFDTNRQQLGTFKEPESLAGKAFGALNPLSDWQTKNFELTDAQGTLVLKVDQPQGFKASLKPKFEVSTAAGAPVGTVEQQKVFSGLGFVFTANGVNVGHFEQADRAGFARRFVCRDANGTQIAEFVKRSAGQQSMKEVFTQDDSYVLMRPRPIPEPLGSLVLIAACALDAAFFER